MKEKTEGQKWNLEARCALKMGTHDEARIISSSGVSILHLYKYISVQTELELLATIYSKFLIFLKNVPGPQASLSSEKAFPIVSQIHP